MAAPGNNEKEISAIEGVQGGGLGAAPMAHPAGNAPLARTSSDEFDKEAKDIAMEAAEETESQDSDEKKQRHGNERLQVQRTASTWTQTTGTSIATTDAAEAQTPTPRKRTWGEKLNPLRHEHVPSPPDERKPSREHKAGFFSKLTFQWISPLMSIGYQRPLEVNDVWSVNPDRQVAVMSEKLLSSLKKRKEAGSKRPLAMAMYDTFKREFLIGGACQLTSSIVQILSPFTMKYLIAFAGRAYYASLNDTPAPHIANGVGLVIGITLMQVIQSLCTNHFIYRGMMVGGEARAVMIAVIFDKAMKISGRARAGGKAKDLEDPEEERPEGMQAGSKEEKAFFKRKLKRNRRKTRRPSRATAKDGAMAALST